MEAREKIQDDDECCPDISGFHLPILFSEDAVNSVDRPAFRHDLSPIRPGGSSLSAMKSRFRAHVSNVMVVAHRGDWGPLPENSLAAIRAAARWDGIEVNVRLDGNRTPCLVNDSDLMRVSGQPVSASEHTASTRDGLRLRSGAGGAGAAPTDHYIATLDQAFAAVDGTGAILELDVKDAGEMDEVAHVVASLGCQDLAVFKRDVRGPGDIAALVAFERRYDTMVAARIELRSKADLGLVVALRHADVAAVEIAFSDINLLASATAFSRDLIRFEASTLDARCNCGLSDSLARRQPRAVWERLASAGIGSVLTDEPEALSRYLLTR